MQSRVTHQAERPVEQLLCNRTPLFWRDVNLDLSVPLDLDRLQSRALVINRHLRRIDPHVERQCRVAIDHAQQCVRIAGKGAVAKNARGSLLCSTHRRPGLLGWLALRTTAPSRMTFRWCHSLAVQKPRYKGYKFVTGRRCVQVLPMTSSSRSTWTNSRLPRLAMRASSRRRSVANSSGRSQPTRGVRSEEHTSELQ